MGNFLFVCPARYTKCSVRALLSIFGEDRLIYGSDWPVTKRAGEYAKHKALVTNYFTKKGQETLKEVMYENALKVYGLN